MYILIAAVIGTFAFLLSYFEQLEITNFLFGLALIFNFFSERGMIKEDGLSITVYGRLLIRSIVKILLLMIIYNVLIKMIDLIN